MLKADFWKTCPKEGSVSARGWLKAGEAAHAQANSEPQTLQLLVRVMVQGMVTARARGDPDRI